MATTHTPGPWSLSPSGMTVLGADRQLHNPICWSHDTQTSNAARRANARLIAAAPELLEALRALLAWGRDYTSPTDAHSPHTMLVAAAAAIAKAEGATL